VRSLIIEARFATQVSKLVRFGVNGYVVCSAGFIRGCRPGPRRAAASSSAFSFAPKSPRGLRPTPVAPRCEAGGIAGLPFEALRPHVWLLPHAVGHNLHRLSDLGVSLGSSRLASRTIQLRPCPQPSLRPRRGRPGGLGTRGPIVLGNTRRRLSFFVEKLLLARDGAGGGVMGSLAKQTPRNLTVRISGFFS
jgi:hypothetical protein